jgi:hypothetical protein
MHKASRVLSGLITYPYSPALPAVAKTTITILYNNDRIIVVTMIIK